MPAGGYGIIIRANIGSPRGAKLPTIKPVDFMGDRRGICRRLRAIEIVNFAVAHRIKNSVTT